MAALKYLDEKRFDDEALARLSAEADRLQNRLDAMYGDKLDGKINESFDEHKAGEWRGEQDRIAEGSRNTGERTPGCHRPMRPS